MTDSPTSQRQSWGTHPQPLKSSNVLGYERVERKIRTMNPKTTSHEQRNEEEVEKTEAGGNLGAQSPISGQKSEHSLSLFVSKSAFL